MDNKLGYADINNIKKLAGDPSLPILFDILKEKYKEAWAATRLDDEQHREHLYRMMLTVDALQSEITGVSLDQAVKAYNTRLRIVQA